MALVHTGFKQNLFIDGYIRLSATGEVGSFDDYLARVCPEGISREKLDAEISRGGVEVVEMRRMSGFEPVDLGDLPESNLEYNHREKQKERIVRNTKSRQKRRFFISSARFAMADTE